MAALPADRIGQASRGEWVTRSCSEGSLISAAPDQESILHSSVVIRIAPTRLGTFWGTRLQLGPICTDKGPLFEP